MAENATRLDGKLPQRVVLRQPDDGAPAPLDDVKTATSPEPHAHDGPFADVFVEPGSKRGGEVRTDAPTFSSTKPTVKPWATRIQPTQLDRLSPQELIASMKTASSPRVAVYQESLRRSTPDALATQRYGGTIGTDALAQLRALGERFTDLVADPGIVMRIDDFIAFTASRDTSTIGAWELREAYSEHLGVAQVYRGLALKQEQADETRAGGMPAGYLRADENGNSAWSTGDPFTQNVFSMMKERIRGGGFGPISAAPKQPALDALMSVSFSKKIANDVTAGLIKQIQAATDQYPDLKVFIFHIEIPELDLLPGPVFDAFKDSGYVNRDELFAPFFIKRSEITQMEGPFEPKALEE